MYLLRRVFGLRKIYTSAFRGVRERSVWVQSYWDAPASLTQLVITIDIDVGAR